jgi:hypothetical protein
MRLQSSLMPCFFSIRRIPVVLSITSCIRELSLPFTKSPNGRRLIFTFQPRLAYRTLEFIAGFPLEDKHQTGIRALLWHAGEKNIANL